MTQLNEAIARYHRLLEGDAFRDLEWADTLQATINRATSGASNGRISPVLRPHFITGKQYSTLVKAAESLHTAIDRVEQLALSTPSLLSRMEMLPAEKMLATVDPGYTQLAVTSLLDTHLNNGTLQFVNFSAGTPVGVVYGDKLNEAFAATEPMKAFRKKYPQVHPAESASLLDSLLEAYKQFGGKKKPNIAIVQLKQQFTSVENGEFHLIADQFRAAGYRTEIVSPDQLEYRNKVLRKGDFDIDLVYRQVRVSEFLVRFDLNHPLVKAYRDHSICVVNSFRSEMAQRKLIFDLLTDDTVTGHFPAAERKTIRDYLPWTRRVIAGNAMYHEESIDLPEFIQNNREKLVLLPNEDNGERGTFVGADLDTNAWDKALKTALRGSYVVQETGPSLKSEFPLYRYGNVEMRDMHVDVHPHAFLGRVKGCSTWLTPAKAGFSTISGLAPTFILDAK